jgi:hypothetical protein
MLSRCCFTLIFWLALQVAICQQALWQSIGVDGGLPDPNITAIVKANDQKLYIGTAIGLFSYDGYAFKKLNYRRSKKSILILIPLKRMEKPCLSEQGMH